MRFATGGLEPDLTVLMDLSLEQAWQRLGSSVDRFEGEGREFLDRVASRLPRPGRKPTPSAGRLLTRTAPPARSQPGS